MFLVISLLHVKPPENFQATSLPSLDIWCVMITTYIYNLLQKLHCSELQNLTSNFGDLKFDLKFIYIWLVHGRRFLIILLLQVKPSENFQATLFPALDIPTIRLKEGAFKVLVVSHFPITSEVQGNEKIHPTNSCLLIGKTAVEYY